MVVGKLLERLFSATLFSCAVCSQEECDRGVTFNYIGLSLNIVIIFELVTFINFDFVTQHVALDHFDVRDRDDLVESRRH